MQQKVKKNKIKLIFLFLLGCSIYGNGQVISLDGYLVLHFGSIVNSHHIEKSNYSSLKDVYFFNNYQDLATFIAYIQLDTNKVFIDVFGYPNPKLISFKKVYLVNEVDIDVKNSLYQKLEKTINEKKYETMVWESRLIWDKLVEDNFNKLGFNQAKIIDKVLIFKSKFYDVIDFKDIGINNNKYRLHSLSSDEIKTHSDLILLTDKKSCNELISIIFLGKL